MIMSSAVLRRKKVLLVTLFCGFWGGHHFLLHARRQGLLYLLLAFTMAPAFASTLDLMSMVFKLPGDPVFSVRTPEQVNFISRQSIRHLMIGISIVLAWAAWGVSRG
jgi:TM2 domain-containing membrane protein YozV